MHNMQYIVRVLTYVTCYKYVNQVYCLLLIMDILLSSPFSPVGSLGVGRLHRGWSLADDIVYIISIRRFIRNVCGVNILHPI
jgi:hypothetical protein